MKLEQSFKISLRILVFFSCLIAWSFVPDYLHGFFDDTHCNGTGKYVPMKVTGTEWIDSHFEGCQESEFKHGPTWHWGYRHWVFLIMSICLSIVQLVYTIIKITEVVKKK